MKSLVFLFIILFVSSNLMFAQTKAEKKALKAQKSLDEYNAAKELINSGTYTFEADWATTQKGNRINLTTNSNSLIINNSNAKADLPYFGVAQNISFGGDGGIKFDGEIQDYQMEFDDKKQKIIVKFKARKGPESFLVILSVFKMESASLTLNSNNRNGITYDGKIKPLEIKDK